MSKAPDHKDMDNNTRPASPTREVGIGLRAPHYKDILEELPDIGFIEVHPENYFGGGLHRHFLEQVRNHYALSLHAVGLSLGSDQNVNKAHLQQIKELADIYEPFQISDHVSWSASGNAHLNDLLPLPYTKETLKRLCDNIDRTQNYLGRTILVENPSSYVAFMHNDMTEYEFLNEIVKQSGCGLLLDVNNIYVQSQNHDFDPYIYLNNVNIAPVGEMHLAGHSKREFEKGHLLVDTHDDYVDSHVWDLYEHAIERFGAARTLIEWDSDLPALKDLVSEADKAQSIIDKYKKAKGQSHEAA